MTKHTTISKVCAKTSSIIQDVEYHEDDEKIIVTFHEGTYRYQYSNIDKDLFHQIENAPSLGSFLVVKVFPNPKHKMEILH